MNSTRFPFKSNRFDLLLLLTLLATGISFLTRIALLIKSSSIAELSALQMAGAFALGMLFDLVEASYLIIPLLLYIWLLPETIFQRKWHVSLLYAFYFVQTFLLLFNAVSEWLFWDEFTTRFNFIAVDYLVYTTEVIGNIQQSYPIIWIILILIIISGGALFVLKPFINQSKLHPIRFKTRSLWTAMVFVFPVLSFAFINTTLHDFSSNTIANELAGNGLYELFAAYRNNELNYAQFYPHLSDQEANENITTLLQPHLIASEEFSLARNITSNKPEQKLNVVLISIESFSAEFMGIFGNKGGNTPFLDSLAQHSLSFTNLYATGTRTVRGLEALSLAIPPTPGQSIVRRPHNEDLFTLATVFNKKGYKSKYIYGGYSYFDNMGNFFGSNGYEVVDRSSLADTEIDYENIWGVADENLFTLALREIDKTVSGNQPSFTHIMTTSNHRPFTYPDGRIDIPSHTNREGAVKYTDYAIGKFIKEARKTDWFSNTLFIITADHCASSAGTTDLPINKYKIPMLIFSPTHIGSGIQSRLMSQIDIAPTLLGMLNISYETKFFGYDLNTLPSGKERVFISTYQLLGYLKNDSLVVMAPKKQPEVFLVDKDHKLKSEVVGHQVKLPIVNEAITWYQSASFAFKHNQMHN
ncbi:MAG: sulfatase-like hydrolase/transferase [Cyclobacteriaceae bacterium]|nr:sulfatase-like hydrolase/transferase [Cyclobacteriaceae bacterium]